MGMSVYKTGGGKGKGKERERKRVGRKGKEGENAEQILACEGDQTLGGTFLFAEQLVLAGKGNGCRGNQSLNSLSS